MTNGQPDRNLGISSVYSRGFNLRKGCCTTTAWGLLSWIVMPMVLVAIDLVLCVSIAPGASVVVSDWDDGSLQGWTPVLPFGGSLGVDVVTGNPGGSMFATDSVAQAGGLFAQAPSALTGDLSINSGISWDEFVPDYGSATRVATTVYILSTEGTRYRSDPSLGPIGIWNTRFASFSDSSGWIRTTGTASFEDVVRDVAMVSINLDTSTRASGQVESWVDNITLVGIPIPGDANVDGRVDESDAAELAANWGETSAGWRMGDFDNDGTVGPKDASILAANWGDWTEQGNGSSSVPEPGVLMSLLVSVPMLLLWRIHCW